MISSSDNLVQMTKNGKTVYISLFVAIILIVVILVCRDMLLTQHATFDCGDGPRRRIDIRDFVTKYASYSVELEASVADKVKISTKLNPTQQQQISEATQSASELRKYVVAGYNSCAVTKTQFGQYGGRFQALDSLARTINELTGKPSLDPEETAKLAGLIGQYGELARKLGSE